MPGMLITLIVQIIAGAIGGNIAGGAAKDLSLGVLPAISLPVRLAEVLAGNS